MSAPGMPDPGDAFDPPDGDPSTLATAATTFATLAQHLTTDITAAKDAVAVAVAAWQGPRTEEFKNGILGPQLELAETMAAVKEVGTLTGQLAVALRTAAQKVSDEKGNYDRYVAEVLADPTMLILDYPRALYAISEARAATTTYATTAARVAGEIDAQTNRLVPGGSAMSPDAIARQVARATGVDGINRDHPSLHDAWQVLNAGAVHARAIESLTDDGDNTGEKSGGPYSSLPTDLTALAAMRDAMLADGVTGPGLRAVLHQYWVSHAAQSAGIDLDEWDPSLDAAGNAATIPAVYRYYGQLYLNNPNLKWAGLANIVGPIFAAGFDDLSMIHKLTDAFAHLPGPVRNALPPDLRQLVEGGAQLTSAEVKYFEDKFLAMQKHIFMDIGSQHEAYATGGLQAVSSLHDSGAITDDMWTAWQNVDTGRPDLVSSATTAFANREQNVVIAGQYDEMYTHDGLVGVLMTYAMTTVGGTAVPGSKTPAQVSPVGFDARTEGGWGPFSAESHAYVKTPLPSFNIADKNDRWNYINSDIIPNYLAMTPDQVRALVNQPVENRIADQRILHRLPDVTDHLLTDWDAGASASVSVGPITIGIP